MEAKKAYLATYIPQFWQPLLQHMILSKAVPLSVSLLEKTVK